MRSVIKQLLAEHSGQSIDKIAKDTERDYIMSAQQAKEYGLIDELSTSTVSRQASSLSARTHISII